MQPELRHVEPDVLQLAERLQGLVRLAYTNDLTKLLNRRALDTLSQRLLWQLEGGPTYAVAFLDVTGFKEVNDTYGHDVGDLAIIEVGVRWAKIASAIAGVAFHLSGDEYVMVLEPSKREPFSSAWVSDLSHFRFVSGGEPVEVRTNVGLALPEAGLGIEKLQARAEAACVTGKFRGEREVVVWSKDVDGESRRLKVRWRCSKCHASIDVMLTAPSAETQLACPACGARRE